MSHLFGPKVSNHDFRQMMRYLDWIEIFVLCAKFKRKWQETRYIFDIFSALTSTSQGKIKNGRGMESRNGYNQDLNNRRKFRWSRVKVSNYLRTMGSGFIRIASPTLLLASYPLFTRPAILVPNFLNTLTAWVIDGFKGCTRPPQSLKKIYMFSLKVMITLVLFCVSRSLICLILY